MLYNFLKNPKHLETVRQNKSVSKYSVLLDKMKRVPKQN